MTKEEYIRKITELLWDCNDHDLLDLILSILVKS